MTKMIFVFWRLRSSDFPADGQPLGKRTQSDQIADDLSQQIIQDDSSTESIISPITGRRMAILLAIALVFAIPLCPRLLALDDHNPIGVTGAFEGVVTTGGAYNVLNHSATRQIDDIVVPGSIGKYPLKMTRYYNSRRGALYGILGSGWSHEYLWTSYSGKTGYPNGSTWDNSCTGDWGLPGPLGVSDWPTTWSGLPAFRLADGGTVVFGGVFVNGTTYYSVPTKIIDPYNQTTTISYNLNSLLINKVTAPGGRYLQFIYSAVNGVTVLGEVDAYDGLGNRIDWVVYHYTAISPGGTHGQQSVQSLTSVDYSDGTHAYYTYEQDNVPEDLDSGSLKLFPLVKTCDDTRYHGAMRRIAYDYQVNGPHGAITAERYWDGGVAVSSIGPALVDPRETLPNFTTTFTETRGDGPIRTFNYTELHLHRFNEDTCPTWTFGPAPQQFIQNYTDFQGHTTYLGYDTNWYVNSVQDANGHITTYTRGPSPPTGIGQITKITHPGDNTHIDYTYQTETGAIGGHYVQQITDERGSITYYYRDPSHRITAIYYEDANGAVIAYETFSYNSFGQVLTHRLKNGAWESFVYDGRGLLTDKFNPKQTGVPSGGDPHSHYYYYTSADGKLGWIDRIKKVTLPANDLGNIASEMYEYDRALDANGITNLAGGAVPGRGLVTKITHADNTYQQFKYDAYGNKRWEDNELRQASSYIYDDYNRLLTATSPLGKITSYTYIPTNGGGGSSYKHTTSNADTVTTPAGIKTSNVYDPNFRKTSTTAASGTTLAATTTFGYDNVGNLTLVTDPLTHKTSNTYDSRNRKLTTTEAYLTSLARTTTWHYDGASNIYQIDRPDDTMETKTYDALNRMLSDTVPKTASPVVNLTTWFTYNPSGTILTVTDARGSGPGDVNYTTTFAYDASDRKVSMTYPGNSNQQWVYDDAGNLKNRTTIGGKVQSFTYDNRNRKTGMTWSNGADSATYGYDAAARVTSASNANSYVYRQYDDAGHLTLDQQILGGMSKSVIYGYDDDGKVNRMYVNGVTGYDFTYSYDAMGRLEKIFPTSGGAPFQYYYDAASNETERDNLYNGVNQIYPRDAFNRMQYMDVIKGTTLGRETYTYDMMNRITLVSYTTGPADSFQYYLDDELKTATLGNLGHTLTYNLDNKGNRTSVVDNNVNSPYTPNTIDQYGTAAGLSVVNGAEHEISAYNNVTYTYINDEHLQQVSDGMNIYSMAYDALGRCVKRTLHIGQKSVRATPTPRPPPTPDPRPSPTPEPDDVTTYYIYEGEKPVLEYDADGTEVGVNLYGKGIDEILERVAIGSDSNWYVYYPQQNHQGSVTMLTDSSGNAIERYRYDAFGAPTFYTATWGPRSNTIYDNRFLFTGREYANTYRSTYTTPAFNFYEYRARAYNPKLGRFMSEDPKLFDAGDYNLFRYCHNDPIDFTDPMGTTDSTVTHSAREESLQRVDITIAERISLWQKSMESSIGGNQASMMLQGLAQVPKLEKSNPEASQLSPITPPWPRTMKEFIALGNAIEHGNTMDTTPAIDPIDLLSGGIAGLLRGSVRSVAAKATATRAMWVGKDGLEAAKASGASLLQPSETALRAMRAGDMSIMQAESAAWARGASGHVPVFFGNGAGRTFLNHEFPELLKNMNSGQVTSIDITF